MSNKKRLMLTNCLKSERNMRMSLRSTSDEGILYIRGGKTELRV